jgi:hypothetical protein
MQVLILLRLLGFIWAAQQAIRAMIVRTAKKAMALLMLVWATPSTWGREINFNRKKITRVHLGFCVLADITILRSAQTVTWVLPGDIDTTKILLCLALKLN